MKPRADIFAGSCIGCADVSVDYSDRLWLSVKDVASMPGGVVDAKHFFQLDIF